MVFRHFFNMIGDTEDERNKKIISSQDINSQNAFLSDLAIKVNKYDVMSNPTEKTG